MKKWIIRNKLLTVIISGIITIILTNLQFLPTIAGFHLFKLSNLTYNFFGMLCVFVLFFSLFGIVGLIWILIKEKRLSKRAFLIIALGLFCYLNAVIIPKQMRHFAKNIVIKNATELIESIDNYYVENSKYPESLDILIPIYIDKIPKPGLHGIKEYRFENLDNNYEIKFFQNSIASFNYDVVIYNPKGEQLGRGRFPKLIETGFENWKYYWSD